MKRFKMLWTAGAVVFLGFLGLGFISKTALAAIPQIINTQGVLRDGSGNPVPDASYSTTFRIYDAASGGIVLWFETQSVATLGGQFNVNLGSITPIPNSVFDSPTRWLGIQVSPDPEMTPRQRLVSVGYSYRVNSVDGAMGGTITSKVSIGPEHTNIGANAFVAGEHNTANDDYATVSGGINNTASSLGATVGGGETNTAGGVNSVWPTVGGGKSNTASGLVATVAGGGTNTASGDGATIGGGTDHVASDNFATISGGFRNVASALFATVGGGIGQFAIGQGATIGGGGSNTASGVAATVSGGDANSASRSHSVVSGGIGNRAEGDSSTVGGGARNVAVGLGTTVGGGWLDSAIGVFATVPGGYANRAAGNYSLAAGRFAKANHEGAFVWADNPFGTGAVFTSSAANQFNVRASGGTRIFSNAFFTAGVTLAAGASAWVAASDSNLKRNIRTLDSKEILEKVMQLPIKRWSYKAQDPSIEHIGPMAQEFYPLFQVGEDPLKISTIDPPGIALAAIQGLYQIMEEQKRRIEYLEKELKEMQAEKPKAEIR